MGLIISVLDFVSLRLIWFVVFAIFLSTLFFLSIKFYRRKSIEKLELYKYQMQALINQINPHFIFNTLNSIQLYIYKNDKQKSIEYISNFSKLMRQVLDNSKEQLITIGEEVEIIKSYVELELMRFENKFEYNIFVDRSISQSKILPLITQPYLENSIWHGFMLKETKGLLEISFKEFNGNVLVVIKDNGIGIKKSKEINFSNVLKGKGHGTNIGEERLRVFNKVFRKNAQVTITDCSQNADGEGVNVTIEFPRL